MFSSFWAFAITAFLAVVLLAWGGHGVWTGMVGKEQKILTRRWQSLSIDHDPQQAREDHPKRLLNEHRWAQRLLVRFPGVQSVDRFLLQTGLPLGIADALFLLVSIFFGTLLTGLVVGLNKILMALFVGLNLFLPLWFLLHHRKQRIAKIESHLPDVLDLIARSMLAGHAFTSALQMAANDAKPPIAAELHKVFDEINFGLDLRLAMSGMAERVASDDLRFFVTSVLIQHETGGNLADILKNTASLIRERQKIRGVIRVLSGEGRISAWILSLLPFALAVALNAINPEFVSTLWTEPLGLQMLYSCLFLMLVGIVWMWRLIDIRI
jgi:tight adherence protein B